MIRQDYFKRQMDQLGRVLGKMLADLMGQKEQGNPSISIEVIDIAIQNELGIDIERLVSIDNNDFIGTLRSTKALNDQHFETLGGIFFTLAEEAADLSIKRERLYEKCLIIFQHLEKNDTTFSLERRLKIEKLKKYLD